MRTNVLIPLKSGQGLKPAIGKGWYNSDVLIPLKSGQGLKQGRGCTARRQAVLIPLKSGQGLKRDSSGMGPAHGLNPFEIRARFETASGYATGKGKES